MSEQEPHSGGVKERARQLLATVWRFICVKLWPGTKRCMVGLYGVTRQRVVPAVGAGSARLKGEVAKIHSQQDWRKRSTATLTGNAAGLGMAMLSTRVVESLVEKREFGNLWGVLAERPVVSEATFELLSFVVEFILALIVFTVTEYYINEYQRKRAVSVMSDEEDENRSA
ncbi:MAG: hypothetical protein OEZ16_00415 [Chromatiales bacterium]|nr:hypothetical protein [Chromatiales bacterium]